jgi:hypothetical protein
VHDARAVTARAEQFAQCRPIVQVRVQDRSGAKRADGGDHARQTWRCRHIVHAGEFQIRIASGCVPLARTVAEEQRQIEQFAPGCQMVDMVRMKSDRNARAS